MCTVWVPTGTALGLALTEFYYHLLLASAWCPSRARGACVVVKKIENIILDWIRNPDNHHWQRISLIHTTSNKCSEYLTRNILFWIKSFFQRVTSQQTLTEYQYILEVCQEKKISTCISSDTQWHNITFALQRIIYSGTSFVLGQWCTRITRICHASQATQHSTSQLLLLSSVFSGQRSSRNWTSCPISSAFKWMFSTNIWF